MARRIFDVLVAGSALALAAPVIAVGAVAVKLSSPGPAFYNAARIGLEGRLFRMFKLRTMHCREAAGSSITSATDSRVFLVGRLLRLTKVDELPQLWNIVRGDMSIVGPRPEAPDIVEHHYTDTYRESLDVLPGLTSPGSIYYYTHGEQILAEDGADAEELYVQRLLPQKMAIDLQYQRNATLLADLRVIATTAVVLFQKALGRQNFPEPRNIPAPLPTKAAGETDSTTTSNPASFEVRRAA
ncbi:MAG: O-antigen biosynthesis protein WlbG [Fuerstiella sp.]